MKATLLVLIALWIWIIYEMKKAPLNKNKYPMKETLGMIKFFFISVPVFLMVYCSVMIYIEIKEYIKKYE